MGKFGLSKLIPVGIGLLTFAGFVGSISGSLAWWAYSTRVTVSYQGTSVTTSEQLQIGLKISKANPTKAEEIVTALVPYGVTEDTHIADENFRYVFAKAGGGMSADAVKTYLTTEGTYAIDELAPVTSKAYAEGSALTLYESLLAGRADNDTVALPNKYVHIPFVFRILKLNAVGSDDDFAPGRKIYLSKVQAEASSSLGGVSAVHNALRVFFNNGTAAERFILNVGDNREWDDDWTTERKNTELAAMYTNVAGILDLNRDGYYDYDALTGEEIMYGVYSGTATNKHIQGSQVSDPTGLDDVNDVYANIADPSEKAALLADDENTSTFLAKHVNGNNCYYGYEGLTLGKAYYRTVNSIKPNDANAILTGGRVLCTTADSAGKYLAELDTIIWLEGWDHVVIDKALSHKFNLGLQFQIDLVN